MSSRSEDTKARLLGAARDEFAAHGIAGARTGRIARAAGANEALLFRYFGSKQELFAHAYDSLVTELTADVPIDGDNLPEFAGALFDYYREHESVLRMAMWAALERPAASATQGVLDAAARNERVIADAQRTGKIATRLAPGELYALIIHLSFAGAAISPTVTLTVDSLAFRAAVVTAVKSLVELDEGRQPN